MLPQFVNRELELKFLEDLYKKDGFRLFVLYGRRRIGKTELLKHFLKNKKGVYLLVTDESLEENIKELKNKFYNLTNRDYFLKIETNSFNDLFKYLVEEIKKTKIVIVFDEFPYLFNLNKGILSTFQKIIDESLKNSNVMLILCGSSMSIMENDVVSYRSPLYGRDMNSWKLLPFNFKIINRVVDNMEKALESYFVFGNVPYYFKFYNKKIGLMDSIKDNVLTKGAALYDEPLILLRQEFRESRTYKLILKYISLGFKSIGKLCSATGMDKSNIMKYLSTLEEVGIVRHIIPFGMKRKGVYEIIDPFFRFWFKFVYPNRDKLEVGNISEVSEIIKKEIDSSFGISFEYLIEELINLKVFSEFLEYSKAHKWWHKDKEIDVIALNEKTKEILFCECKWRSRVNAKKIIKGLLEKSRFVHWNNEKRKENFAIFAKSFSKRIKEFNGKKVYCFSLKDLSRVLENEVKKI